MGDKSGRNDKSKTAASKTLKEKRQAKTDKKARDAKDASIDAISNATKKR